METAEMPIQFLMSTATLRHNTHKSKCERTTPSTNNKK